MKSLLSLLSLLLCITSWQTASAEEVGARKKGTVYVYWGWNRAAYSNSDIRFKGNGYDFTLNSVKASDRPTEFGIDPYFNPSSLTIPQTNSKIGYFIDDNLSLSFGVDHMKYVMINNQTVHREGTINTGGNFDGVYDGDLDLSDKSFLTYEHTDGLNYVNLEINKFSHLAKFYNQNLNLSYLVGAGVGFLYPKSNVTLMDNKKHDDFNVAGYGVNVKVGLNLAYDRVFIQSEYKFGYIDMPNIRTTDNSSDMASQNFTFQAINIVMGYYF
jgi:hypothetical protein